MKSNLQKIEVIQEKIRHLKIEQDKIEQDLVSRFVQVLNATEAFQIDFDSMIGGILETIDTIRADPIKMEAWRVMGKKFCKSNANIKHKRTNKAETKMEA